MKTSEIIERGRRVVRMERQALEQTEIRIDESFAKAVEILARSTGRAKPPRSTAPGASGTSRWSVSNRSIAFILTHSDACRGGSTPSLKVESIAQR